jgi:multiple sugar transport system substrate-binding protein
MNRMPRRGGRRSVLPVVAAVLAVALTGCGGLSQTRLLGSDSGGSLTTLGFGQPDEIASARVDLYKKKHPDVDLRINEGGFDAQQFLSAVASGRPPDLVYLDREVLGSYAHRGALEPLTSCVDRAGIRLGDFREAAVAQTTVDGVLYGVPEFAIVPVLLVNDKAAAEAGVRPQDIDTSDWQGLAALGEKMTKRDGGKLSRLGFYPKVPDFFPLWVRAAGGDILSEDGSTASLDSPQSVEALQYAKNVYDRAGGYPAVKAFNDSWDFFGAKNQFATDQVGMMLMENWYLNVLADVSPDAPVTVLPFTDRQKKPLTWGTGSAWAIPKGAKHVDQACDFIATMTASDTWIAAAKVRAEKRATEKKPFTGLYTANKVADEAIYRDVYKPSGVTWLDEGVKVLVSVQDAAFTSPPSPAGAEVKDEWESGVNRVLQNGDDVTKTLQTAQRQAQSAIDRTAAEN